MKSKNKSRYYWVIVVVVILVNVTLFKYFSSRLENFIVQSTLEAQARNGL